MNTPNIDVNRVLGEMITIRMTRYVPHKPTPKQIAFLLTPHDEVLYGGALGGGKSDALLMAALQYVDVPGYSALIIRKTLTDLKQSGALLDRMASWMRPWVAKKIVRYEASSHRFVFPTLNPDGSPGEPAKVQFGYLGQLNAETRYQGIEIQFLGVDEITQHKENDYTYLLTRLRKNVCRFHTERDSLGNPIYLDDCPLCQQQKSLPIRARATCNPDGIGFQWVKKRWNIQPVETDESDEKGEPKVRWVGKNPKRPFIPASYKDNPYLDHKAYEQRMKDKLSDELYQALMEGSWGVIANARFKRKWIRLYSMHGNHLYFGPNMTGRIIDIENHIAEVFLTVDTATTSLEGPGDIELFGNRVHNPSNTCICAWMLTKCYNLLWADVLIFRDEIPVVIDELKRMYDKWKPSTAVIETNGIGKGVFQFAQDMGMEVTGIHKDRDKIVSATQAIIQMRNGRIWFPQATGGSQFDEAIEEVFTWQGHPSEPDDVVDNLSLAANYVDWSHAAHDPDDYFAHHDSKHVTLPGVVYPKYRYTT